MFLAKDDGCRKKNSPAETDDSSGDSSVEDEPPEPDTTLFVKNLNFSTNEEDIREVSIGCIMLQHVIV
jgi:multiple RNA-binding domain-containing protein 1